MQKLLFMLLLFCAVRTSYSQVADTTHKDEYHQLVPAFLQYMDKWYRFNFNPSDTIYVDINRNCYYYYEDALHRSAYYPKSNTEKYTLWLRNNKTAVHHWEFAFDSRYFGYFDFLKNDQTATGYKISNYKLTLKSSHRLTSNTSLLGEFSTPPIHKRARRNFFARLWCK